MPDATAVLVGLTAGAVGALLAVVGRAGPVGPVEATALAAAVVGRLSGLVSTELALALVVVLMGARLPDRFGPLKPVALVGAALIVSSEVSGGADDPVWWAVAGSVVVLATLGRLARSSVGPLPTLILVTWLPMAAYLATPDTETVTVVAIAFAVACAVVAVGGRPVAPGAVDAAVVAVVGAVVADGAERDASYLVLSASVLLVHAGALVARGRRIDWTPASVAIAATMHVAIGVLAARWVALGRSWSVNSGRATLLVVVALVAAAPLVWRFSEPVELPA